MPLPDDVVQQRAGNDLFDGIHHGVQFGLVDVVVPDYQGDGPGGHRIDDGTEAVLLAEQDQVGVRLRNDGDAAVVVDDLNQNAYAAAFEESFVREGPILQMLSCA